MQERGGIFSKMKRFFGVDVYEPEHDEAQEGAEKEQAVKEQSAKAETKPEPQPELQPVIDEEALARAEAERAERLKALHAAAEEEVSAAESAAEEGLLWKSRLKNPLRLLTPRRSRLRSRLRPPPRLRRALLRLL